MSIAEQLARLKETRPKLNLPDHLPLPKKPPKEIEPQKNTKVMALFDVHWPDNINLDPTVRFMREFDPDLLILGGDIWGLDCISHHDFDRMDIVGYENVIAEFWRQAKEFPRFLSYLTRNAPNARVVYIVGNHERWIEKYTGRFKGQFETPTLRGIVGEDIDVVDGFYTIGHLSFCHGDQFRGGVNKARSAIQDAKKTVVFGHWHTYQAYADRSCVDDEAKYLGICAPCLTTRDPAYNRGRPNAGMQGFFTATVKPSGKFSHHVQLIGPKGNFISQAGVEYE